MTMELIQSPITFSCASGVSGIDPPHLPLRPGAGLGSLGRVDGACAGGCRPLLGRVKASSDE